jgi:hypothetical protein
VRSRKGKFHVQAGGMKSSAGSVGNINWRWEYNDSEKPKKKIRKTNLKK